MVDDGKQVSIGAWGMTNESRDDDGWLVRMRARLPPSFQLGRSASEGRGGMHMFLDTLLECEKLG